MPGAGSRLRARRIAAAGARVRRVRDLPIAGERVDARFFQAPVGQPIAGEDARLRFAPERCVQALEAVATLPFERRRESASAGCSRPASRRALNSARAASAYFRRAHGRAHSLISPRDTPVREVERRRRRRRHHGQRASRSPARTRASRVTVIGKPTSRRFARGLARLDEHHAGAARKGRITEAQAKRATRAVARHARLRGARGRRSRDRGRVREHGAQEGGLRAHSIACKSGAILATNTSTLDVNEIAADDETARRRASACTSSVPRT